MESAERLVSSGQGAYKICYVNYCTWENVQNFLLGLAQKPLEDQPPLSPKSR